MSCYRRKEQNMDAAMLQDTQTFRGGTGIGMLAERLVSAAEFHDLLVSHRKMVRVDRR